jgi:membrane protein required for colicin V production
MDLTNISLIDGASVAILFIAFVRGLMIGVVRETFSIAALGSACIAVLYATEPAAIWLGEISQEKIGPTASYWISAAAVALTAMIGVSIAGTWVKKIVRAVGLGWADRIAGAVLGAAEGALVVISLLFVVIWVIGEDHPLLADSESVVIFGDLQDYVVEYAEALPEEVRDATPDVAAPPN